MLSLLLLHCCRQHAPSREIDSKAGLLCIVVVCWRSPNKSKRLRTACRSCAHIFGCTSFVRCLCDAVVQRLRTFCGLWLQSAALAYFGRGGCFSAVCPSHMLGGSMLRCCCAYLLPKFRERLRTYCRWTTNVTYRCWTTDVLMVLRVLRE